MKYTIDAIIENKQDMPDPEGEKIFNDVNLRGNNINVKSVQSAQIIIFDILAENKNGALEKTRQICDELRIYNPISSKITISINNRENK